MNHGNICADIKVKEILAERPILHMYELQQLLQTRLGKQYNSEDSFEDISLKVIYWRQCIHSECDELLEWLDGPQKDLEYQEIEMEIIDVLHFVFNIGIVMGIGAHSLDRILKPYVDAHDTLVDMTLLGSPQHYICSMSGKLTKLIDLLPWKSWKTYDDPVPELAPLMEAYANVIQANFELAAFHGLTMERIVSVYCAKNAENHRRQDNGY